MPYFPTQTELAYQCPACGGWFIPSDQHCLVAHAPGTCCHQYEQVTLPPQPVRMLNVHTRSGVPSDEILT